MPEPTPQRKKNLQEVLDRMEKGFDENMLDPLLKSIYDEPETEEASLPSESQVKYKKKKYQVIKVAPTAQGDSLAGFLGGKLQESFRMAAAARQASSQKKGKAFFLKKALKFNFGGDLINRTRGTFSKDPTEVQDPALGKSGRFSAEVQPYMDPIQGPAPAPEQQQESVVEAADTVIKSLDELGEVKDDKDQQLQLALEIQQDVSQKVSDVVEENNNLLKKSNIIKNRFLRFQSDQEETKVNKAVEARGEHRNPMKGLLPTDNSRDDEEEEEEEEGRGNPFMDFLDFGMDVLDGGSYFGKSASLGRRGASRILKRTAIRLGGKELAKRGAVKVAQGVVTKAATTLAPKAVLGFLRPIFKRVPIVGGLIDFVVSLALGEPVGRAAAKAVGATLGSALGSLIPFPLAGTILGGYLGDKVGGVIYDAITGGGSGKAEPSPRDEADETKRDALAEADSTKDMSAGEREALVQGTRLPDAGGAGSIENVGDPLNDPLGLRAPTKLASGGVIAGEAGPEAVFNLSSTVGRSTLKSVSSVSSSISALPFILGITQDLINSTPGTDSIKPFLSQYMAPLIRMFGTAKFNIQSMLGSGMEKLTGISMEKGAKSSTEDGKTGEGGADAQETMSGQPITGIPLGAGDTATGQTLHAGLTSRGFTSDEAAAIVGNLWAESGFNTGARNPTSGAYGLMQWLGGRYDRLVTFAAEKGTGADDLNTQLDYIAWELKGGNQYETAQFVKAMAYGPTVADKTRGFAYEVERASDHELQESMAKRVGAAQSVLQTTPAPQNPQQGPPAADVPPPAGDLDKTGGHDDENPGGQLVFHPPISKDSLKQVGPAPQGSAQAAIVNMPTNVSSSVHAGGVVQPIIIKTGSRQQVVGYRSQRSGAMGSSRTTIYTKKGEVTTLADIKRTRLDQN